MGVELKTDKDPELKVVRALYPSGAGDASGILIDADLYSELWTKYPEIMRGHNVTGRAGGNRTFVSGIGLDKFMLEFGFWIEDEEAKPVDMTGLKG